MAPGNRVTLIATLALPRDLHVYAPGVQGYKPIALELSADPQFIAEPASYPKSKVLLLPAIGEKVPVFEGKFRIAEDVTIAFDKDFSQKIAAGPSDGTPLTLRWQSAIPGLRQQNLLSANKRSRFLAYYGAAPEYRASARRNSAQVAMRNWCSCSRGRRAQLSVDKMCSWADWTENQSYRRSRSHRKYPTW